VKVSQNTRGENERDSFETKSHQTLFDPTARLSYFLPIHITPMQVLTYLLIKCSSTDLSLVVIVLTVKYKQSITVAARGCVIGVPF
jgi:hypothetical protein